MKEIKAYIRENRLAPVVAAEVQPEFVDISKAAPAAHYAPMVKVELVCPARQTGEYARIIQEQARTGERGDGVIFISAVEDAVHIRTGERGHAAL